MKKTEKIDVHAQPVGKFTSKINPLKKFSQSVKKSAGEIVVEASLVLVLGACDPEIEPVNQASGNFDIKGVFPTATSVQIEVESP